MRTTSTGLNTRKYELLESIASCNGKLATYNLVLQELKSDNIRLLVKVLKHDGDPLGDFPLFSARAVEPFLFLLEKVCSEEIAGLAHSRTEWMKELAFVTATLQLPWTTELAGVA